MIRVGFWNVNMGKSSSGHRIQAFHDWCKWAQPHLLMLEEVGKTVDEKFMPGDVLGAYETLDVHDELTGKRIWAIDLSGKKLFSDAKALGSELGQKRAALKTHFVGGMSALPIWAIHAKASVSGGKEEVALVAKYLSSMSGSEAVVGGDFNCPIEFAQAVCKETVHPLAWDKSPLKFTQWNKDFGSSISASKVADYHLTSDAAFRYVKVLSHGVIDYVMHGKGRKVVAEPNCADEKMWIEILKEFDHCPVLYTVA